MQEVTVRKSVAGLCTVLVVTYVLLNIRMMTADEEYWYPFGKYTASEDKLPDPTLDGEPAVLAPENSGLHSLLLYKCLEVKDPHFDKEAHAIKLEAEAEEMQQLVLQLRYAWY